MYMYMYMYMIRPENRRSVFAFFCLVGVGSGLLTSLAFVPHDLHYDRLCNSLHIRQGTLEKSSLLPCTHFMLRWKRLLYFVAHTSGYVGYVFFTS